MIALAVFAGLLLLMLVQPFALVRLLARAFPDIVWLVKTEEPLAGLTFDDGPHPLYTPRVLEILARHQSRATFFLIGENARRYPELVERIRRLGHEIGNHTDTTASTFFLPTKAFGADLLRAETTLGLEGNPCKLFRPAGGWVRPAQVALAKRHGYTCVLGSAYAYDPYRLPAVYIRWVIGKNLRSGVIAVLHDAGGNRSNTIAALEGVLEAGRARGLRWVTLSELLSARKEESV
jgi:peptidoglycan/xylan/chitin deacetylase (PgdA/CDA1 family)